MNRKTLVLAALLAAAAPAVATVLVPAGFGELAREALTIVHGRVVDVRSEWVDGRKRIETVVTLDVQAALKGQPGRTVSVRVPGGDMGRYRSIVIGAPRFREGEEVVLFLGGRAPAIPHLLGLSQGVYRVMREPGTGRALVTPPAIAAQAGVVPRGDVSRRPLTMGEFAQQVAAAVGARDKERESGRPVPQQGRGR
jgi:hypothetical protein